MVILWIFSLLSAGHALLMKRDPRAALGWIVTCLAIPGVGALLYWLLGVNLIRTRAREMLVCLTSSCSYRVALTVSAQSAWNAQAHAPSVTSEPAIRSCCGSIGPSTSGRFYGSDPPDDDTFWTPPKATDDGATEQSTPGGAP